MRRTFRSTGLVILTAGVLFGQSATDSLKFEVASIKPSAPGAPGSMIRMQPGGVQMTNVTVKTLLTLAYDVRDFQISGGPGWVSSDRFDLNAKTDRSVSSEDTPEDPRKMTEAQRQTLQDQMRRRVQALLAERFQLSVHRETKEQQVYALVVGKSGSKLQDAKEGEANRGSARLGRGQITGTGVKLQFLAQMLSNQMGRPVLDKTGLPGDYDFTLTWTPEPGQGGGPLGPPPPGVELPPPPDPNGPTIFTALQEQLGLRLESTKGPVEVIVIDRVEKASEN